MASVKSSTSFGQEKKAGPAISSTVGSNRSSIDSVSKKTKKDSNKLEYASLDYDGLEEDEIKILKAQVHLPNSKIGYLTLFRYANSYDKFLLSIACITGIISGAALPLFTLIFGNITQIFAEFFVYHTNPDEFQHTVNTNTLYFVYLGIGIAVTSFISTYLHVDRGEVITARIRKHYLQSILRQNISYFDHIGAGEITTRITSDITLIQDGISEKVGIIFAGFSTFIAAFVIGFIKSWRMTLILLSTVVVILLDLGVISSFLLKHTVANSTAVGEACSMVEDVLSSIRNTVAFNSQKRLAKKFEEKLGFSLRAGISEGKLLALMVAILWSAIYLNYGLAFWQGSRFIADGVENVGALLTVVLAILIGAFAFGGVSPSFQAIGSAMGAAQKIFEAIDRVPVIDAGDDNVGNIPKDFEGRIEFEHVKFTYPSRPNVPILEDFSLTIEPGQTVALVGSSGSGKSTIINLLERFYSPIGGSITVDGRPLESLNIKWLRQQMSLVSQEPTLFSCSIYKNIAFGLIGTTYENADDETTMNLIINACKEANAWDFIQSLTDGIHTEVGERGFLLSGGQKQRIAIARAIVSEPKLLLLDEATSALDTKSEGIVQEALDRALQSRTTIVIAHRLSTIKDADKIVVMSHGKIVEVGTHMELIQKQGAYHLLVKAQNIRAHAETSHSTVSEVKMDDDDDDDDLNRKLSLTQTVDSDLSVSAQVVQDLEVKGFYEKPVKVRSSWSLIKFLFFISPEDRKLIYIGCIAAVFCGVEYPLMSLMFGKCINALMVPDSEYGEMRHSINVYAGIFIVLAGAAFISYMFVLVSLSIHTQRLVYKIRSLTFLHFLNMDISFFDDEKNSTGSLTQAISKSGQDIEGFGGSTLGQVLNSLSILIAGFIMAIVINWRLGLVCAACIPVLIGCGLLRFSIMTQIEEHAKTSYEMSGMYACEGVAAIRTVASLTREESVLKTYVGHVKSQVKQSRIPLLRSAVIYGLSQGLTPLVMGLSFWYGSTLIRKGISDSYQFFTAFSAIVFGAQSAGQIFAYAPNMGKARQAAQNIAQIFDILPTIDSTSTEGVVLSNVTGDIDFCDVHFRYPTRRHVPVLRGINLSVKHGQYVALVGPSGCGKSTTISLLEMFYRPLVGKILIDGVDISTLNISDYRSHIGLVQQEPVLYQGTIRENILLGASDIDAVSEDDLYNAARKANIHDFIMSLPDGYETLCGNKGTLLSGGQKQRIAIARALIRNPKILLLDEATSALDSESEKVVQAALDSAAKGRTTIAVAHRLSTIQNADMICVFNDGKIVETGTHEQLLELKGFYAQLVQMQALEKK